MAHARSGAIRYTTRPVRRGLVLPDVRVREAVDHGPRRVALEALDDAVTDLRHRAGPVAFP
jgi:hypothetical protein